MSAINKKNTRAVKKAVSYNGNVQYKKDIEQELFEIVVMTLFGKDSYYESSETRVQRLRDAVSQVVAKGNLDFIANTTVFAREQMHIRSMPVILTVLFAEALRDQGKKYDSLRSVVRDVIQRADQLTDMYSFALSVFGNKKSIPMAIKRGVADAFNKFDEYQFAKYNRKDAVKLNDVLRMVHPKPANETQGQLFEKIVKDELKTPYTWEVELSKNGQVPAEERKSEAQLWTELFESGKIGYMALLRNLRNILDAKVSKETLKGVADRIRDPKEVAKSKQLPFRFISALDSISGHNSNVLNNAINDAVDASLGNVPQIGERVWVIVDSSGSMMGGFYGYGDKKNIGGYPFYTASLFAAAVGKASKNAENFAMTMFSGSAWKSRVNLNGSVLSVTQALIAEGQQHGGGSTNLQAALDSHSKLGFEPDTIVLFSDMQVDHMDGRGVKVLNTPGLVKVAVNLNAYDSTPASTINGWYQLSGWSDKIFDFIPAMREKVTIVKKLSGPYSK